ncbi:MAG: hypothetical protein ABIS06_04530 [Vicinamibacterales bacterium]
MIHETGEVALHEQSRETLTPIVDEPPVGGNDVVGAVTVAWHRVVVGAVTLVEAELPQAAAATIEARSTNSRAVRVFTSKRMQESLRRAKASHWSRATCVLH